MRKSRASRRRPKTSRKARQSGGIFGFPFRNDKKTGETLVLSTTDINGSKHKDVIEQLVQWNGKWEKKAPVSKEVTVHADEPDLWKLVENNLRAQALESKTDELVDLLNKKDINKLDKTIDDFLNKQDPVKFKCRAAEQKKSAFFSISKWGFGKK